jgi:hypothetical protein
MSTIPSRFVRHDLMCTDPRAATRFYSELFGWKPTEVNVMGFTVTRLTAGEKVIASIVPFDGGLGFPSHWIPYVSVDSVEECCRRVSALGGDVCMGATDFPPGRFAVVNDPQKALFSPFEPKDPSLKAERASDAPRPCAGEFCWDELVTNDVAGAGKFYSSLLGWGIKEVDMGPAAKYTLFLDGEVPCAGAMEMGARNPPMWLSYVAVDDADATVASALKLGAKIAVPLADIPGVGRFGVLIDPTAAPIAVMKGMG